MSDLPQTPSPESQHDDLARRLDMLERENDRLRRQVEHLVGPDNPCFDRSAFQRAMRFYMMVLLLPLYLLFVPAVLAGTMPQLFSKMPMIGSVPILSFAGLGSHHPGIGLGLLAFGGLGVGVVGVGGMGVGIIALGGGAVGLLALGGGSLGVIAIGGGAVGYIAIGGGAVGRYVLAAQSGHGKAVFSARRQDPEAVAFFVRWMPRLKAAVTTPLPVILLDGEEKSNG
jgi:hypothetical protein